VPVNGADRFDAPQSAESQRDAPMHRVPMRDETDGTLLE
jgi:hypothetical protein